MERGSCSVGCNVVGASGTSTGVKPAVSNPDGRDGGDADGVDGGGEDDDVDTHDGVAVPEQALQAAQVAEERHITLTRAMGPVKSMLKRRGYEVVSELEPEELAAVCARTFLPVHDGDPSTKFETLLYARAVADPEPGTTAYAMEIPAGTPLAVMYAFDSKIDVLRSMALAAKTRHKDLSHIIVLSRDKLTPASERASQKPSKQSSTDEAAPEPAAEDVDASTSATSAASAGRGKKGRGKKGAAETGSDAVAARAAGAAGVDADARFRSAALQSAWSVLQSVDAEDAESSQRAAASNAAGAAAADVARDAARASAKPKDKARAEARAEKLKFVKNTLVTLEMMEALDPARASRKPAKKGTGSAHQRRMKEAMVNVRFERFLLESLQGDIMTHCLVGSQIPLRPSYADAVIARYCRMTEAGARARTSAWNDMLDDAKNQLPGIWTTDPVVSYLGLLPGTIMQVTETHGGKLSYEYRRVDVPPL